MESIQSALFIHTGKHFYSFQEEWAAAIRKAEYNDEGIKALPRSHWHSYSQLPTKYPLKYRKEIGNNRVFLGGGWGGGEPWLFSILINSWKNVGNERNSIGLIFNKE